MKDILAILRDRNLGILLAGRAISDGGDWLYQIALSVAIFRYSGGSDFYVGVLWLVRLIPSLILGPIGGTLADRIGYRRSMIIADLSRFVLVGALALLLHRPDWWIIYPFNFVVTCFNTLFRPASVGIIPSLVRSKDQRLAANSAFIQVEALAMIAGCALGGVIAGLGYITQLLLIEAATFAISAATLTAVRPPVDPVRAEEEVEEEQEDEEAVQAALADQRAAKGVLGGFRLILRRPLLVFCGTVMSLPEFASGAIVVWIVPYSVQQLHLGNAGVGYLYCAVGVGSLLGGFIAAAVGGNVRLDNLLAAAVLLQAVAIVIFGVWTLAVGAMVALLLVGLMETIQYASYETVLQQAAPASMLGRVTGTMDSFLTNMMLVGNLLSGILAGTLGLSRSIIGLGILTFGATAISWGRLYSQTYDQPDPSALARVPIFADLPQSVRDWAVRRMLRERYKRGQRIIRLGGQGDKFYVLVKGRVEVLVPNFREDLRVELGPGSFFGELALITNRPRNAYVTALTNVTTYTLTREDFQELEKRAATFKNSLMDVANARLEEDVNQKLALMTRL